MIDAIIEKKTIYNQNVYRNSLQMSIKQHDSNRNHKSQKKHFIFNETNDAYKKQKRKRAQNDFPRTIRRCNDEKASKSKKKVKGEGQGKNKKNVEDFPPAGKTRHDITTLIYFLMRVNKNHFQRVRRTSI